jgi:hypothetical protein
VVPAPVHHSACRCSGKCKICKCAQKETETLTNVTGLSS